MNDLRGGAEMVRMDLIACSVDRYQLDVTRLVVKLLGPGTDLLAAWDIVPGFRHD